MTGISPIQEIIEEIRAGRMVVLVDEEDRENEGDLVFAADFVTPEKINFMAKHGRGLICLTLTEAHCKRLNLPLMVRDNGLPLATNFTLSIEAATGVTTGIARAPFRLLPPGMQNLPTSCSPAISFRCARRMAACWFVPDIPRLAAIWRNWRA